MYDDGSHGDKIAGDNTFTILYPTPNFKIQILQRVKVTDFNNLMSSFPSCGYDTINFTQNISNLVINELMANNKNTIQDEAGEYDDWIELYNTSNKEIDLTGYFLTDDIKMPKKWPLPNQKIGAEQYLIIWADNTVSQGVFHTNFKLNNNGEYIGLYKIVNNNIEIRDEVNFPESKPDTSYGRLPNGNGPFQRLKPTPNAINQQLTKVNESEDFSDSDFVMFPNPVSQVLNLKSKQKTSKIEITVYNNFGSLILQKSFFNNDQHQLDVSALPKGIYYLRLANTRNENFTKSFIKVD
jgi:hypothetical protein